MGRRVVVYTGPTLSADEVVAALPRAVVRPPAARGDLLAEDWRRGDTALVIDGYFRERRSVGHKEFLWLINQGVHVVGAASMGALRAAELVPYGMRGLGGVFAMYVSAEIDGDDEVGVLHGPAELGYPPQTVALVSLRYGSRHGAAEGAFSAESGYRVVQAAQQLPFTARSWDEIEASLGPEDLDTLNILRRGIDSGDWDLKRRDALQALVEVGRPHPDDQARALRPRPIDPGALTGINQNRLLGRRSSGSDQGPKVSDLDVLDAARLFGEDYPALHEDALGELLDKLAKSRGLTPTAYARAKLGCDGELPLPAALASWLTPEEMAEADPDRRLRLVMIRVWPTWASLDWRPTVLDRLRETGARAAWEQTVVRADDAALAAGYRVKVPPPTVCGSLFLRHWRRPGAPVETQVELARRGFHRVEDLGRAVRRFFVYDLERGRAGVRPTG
ncbi:TfuA-like protein [Actinospica robiniae]|uniref:TfuA-like protein n=1 Tax=Actinospica robiniae TaxID=304901 RepID=UPI0003FE884A|nr:TfuA-like protein [Actinospica robiniae]